MSGTPFALSEEELQQLAAVLSSPEHQQGIGDRVWTVESILDLDAELVRVTGRLSGSDDLTEWCGPNVAVRLMLPGIPSELAQIPGGPKGSSRIYTITELDPRTRALSVEMVRHHNASPAMLWLSTAKPGAEIPLTGPRPHRLPGPGEPTILLADSSGLPAARSILTKTPPKGRIMLVAAVTGQVERDSVIGLQGDQAGSLEIRWADPAQEFALASAFEEIPVDPGSSVWAAGEREDVRRIRDRCRDVWHLPREAIMVFGYWKCGMSNTLMDLARLRAASAAMAQNRSLDSTDDLEIELDMTATRAREIEPPDGPGRSGS